MDGIIDPGRGVCIERTRDICSRFTRINADKTKSKTLKCRGSGGSRGFLGLYRWSIFSCALEIPFDSATQPQETSASSASSAFQGLFLVLSAQICGQWPCPLAPV